MLPVCSATPSCSSHSQISFSGGLRPFCPVSKEFDSKCIVEDRVVLGMFNGTPLQKVSLRTQAARSFYSSFVESSEQLLSMDFIKNPTCSSELDDTTCMFYDDWRSSVGNINELLHGARGELNSVESYRISSADEGLMDFIEKSTENADSLAVDVEPETMLSIDIAPGNLSLASSSLATNSDPLANGKIRFDDSLDGFKESIITSVTKGENAVKSSLDAITSSVSSITRSASEAVDNSLNRLFSYVDEAGESTSNRLNSFSGDLTETIKKAAASSVDVLRGAIVAAEGSISNGASFVAYSYGSAKELLPPEVRNTLNLSEERATQLLRPIGATFQQVYIAIEWLERSIGLDPNDPVVPFILVLGTSGALWIFYRVWAYGGYSGDLSPELTLELLAGKEDSVLIDVRPEVLRERDGVPDLRRSARFRYTSVSLPEVDGSVRKLLRGGRDLDDMLLAAVIRNLKVVQAREPIVDEAFESCLRVVEILPLIN